MGDRYRSIEDNVNEILGIEKKNYCNNGEQFTRGFEHNLLMKK